MSSDDISPILVHSKGYLAVIVPYIINWPAHRKCTIILSPFMGSFSMAVIKAFCF